MLGAVAMHAVLSGAIDRENNVNGIEYFNAGGHYYTSFAVGFDTINEVKKDPKFAYQAAQKLALGSQLPDMVWALDAYSQFMYEKFGIADEGKARLTTLMSTMHNLAPEGQGTNDWLLRAREDAGRLVTESIGKGDYLLAGFATHKLGDSYAHVYAKDGEYVPFEAPIGHGVPSFVGADPDNIHFHEDLSREYARDLSARIASGFGVSANDLPAVVNKGISGWTSAFEKALIDRESMNYNPEVDQWIFTPEKGNKVFIQNIVKYEEIIVGNNKEKLTGIGLEPEANLHAPLNPVINLAGLGSATTPVTQPRWDLMFGSDTTDEQASNQVWKAYDAMLKRYSNGMGTGLNNEWEGSVGYFGSSVGAGSEWDRVETNGSDKSFTEQLQENKARNTPAWQRAWQAKQHPAVESIGNGIAPEIAINTTPENLTPTTTSTQSPDANAKAASNTEDISATAVPHSRTITAPSLLDRAFQVLSATVTSVKELVFGVIRAPFDFIGGALAATVNHALGRAEGVSFFPDLISKSFGALEHGFKNTLTAAIFEFSHFDAIHRSAADSLLHIAGDIPIVGGLFYGGQKPETDGGVARTFISSGINGGGLGEEKDRLIGFTKEAEKSGIDANAIPYVHGTVTDVLFSTLNLSHAYAYDFAEQVLSDPKVGRGSLIDLAGQSGGVQRVLEASKILGELGIGVNTIVGTQGPALGRFNNANNIVLTGNAANLPFTKSEQLSSDPISWMGRLLSPLVFGNRVETDFTLKSKSSQALQHVTPYSIINGKLEVGMGDEMIRGLLKYRR